MTRTTFRVRLLPTQTFARFATTPQVEQVTKRTRRPPNPQRTTTMMMFEPTPPPTTVETTTADWRTRSTHGPPSQRPPPGFRASTSN
jgi:hypothetical protein